MGDIFILNTAAHPPTLPGFNTHTSIPQVQSGLFVCKIQSRNKDRLGSIYGSLRN